MTIVSAVACAVFYFTTTWPWAHKTAFECAFGQHDCSTAVATWFLVGMSALAFIAAIIAAGWAGRAYANEVEPRLGQHRCLRVRQAHRIDRAFWLSPEGRLLHDKPAGASGSFKSFHHSFTNLGRCAIGDVCVAVTFYDDLGEISNAIIPIGNIGVSDAQSECHVNIVVPKELLNPDIHFGMVFTDAYTGDRKIKVFLTEKSVPIIGSAEELVLT